MSYGIEYDISAGPTYGEGRIAVTIISLVNLDSGWDKVKTVKSIVDVSMESPFHSQHLDTMSWHDVIYLVLVLSMLSFLEQVVFLDCPFRRKSTYDTISKVKFYVVIKNTTPFYQRIVIL